MGFAAGVEVFRKRTDTRPQRERSGLALALHVTVERRIEAHRSLKIGSIYSDGSWLPIGGLLANRIQLAEVSVCLEDDGEGLPLLLLHGFPATRHLWSRVAPLLVVAGYRVLIPDLVGYGDSEAPGGVRIDMASQAAWMLGLLDKLGVTRPVIIAHDVGSAAAQLMVASAPQRIRGLAVLDGVYAAEWAMDAIASIRSWEPADAHRLFPVLARRLAKSAALREMLSAYQEEKGGWQLIRAARDLDPSQTAEITDRLRSSRVPAIVLWGERDEFLSCTEVGEPLAKLLNAPLIKLPGGHFTPLDCPTEVAEALRTFLARC
jgi:pimeloyl-ACP methyl ester carboxylesterase